MALVDATLDAMREPERRRSRRHQLRRFRHAVRPSPRCARLCRGARSLRCRASPSSRAALAPGDLMVLTADHGCDPAYRGTDHTRECVPVLAFGPGIAGGTIGRRPTFADIGQSNREASGSTRARGGECVCLSGDYRLGGASRRGDRRSPLFVRHRNPLWQSRGATAGRPYKSPSRPSPPAYLANSRNPRRISCSVFASAPISLRAAETAADACICA